MTKHREGTRPKRAGRADRRLGRRPFPSPGLLALLVVAGTGAAVADEPKSPHDEFFWIGEINKASTVINTDEGLLDAKLAPRIAGGLEKVLEDGARPNARRPSSVITFEPLLIKAAGVEATLIHAGRSSQDMLATARAAILREGLLDLAAQLNETTATMVRLARRNEATIVPNYTNGVAAQPNSYGHYLLGHVAGLERDAARLREAYARVDLSPMGTTVLNGTSWPLNRRRMSDYLGFAAPVDNAYDAAQIAAVDLPIEVGAVATGMAIHTGAFVEDVMVQYAGPRPWILLQEGGGNTYVSSAMPQKRNPGLLNDTRSLASGVVAAAMGPVLQAHNLPPGMSDAKRVSDNSMMVADTVAMLASWNKVLNGLVIDPKRALEELNSDWTASQEVADALMRKYRLPFRVGHHFASAVVDYAKAHDIAPSDFPYREARRIYAETVRAEMPEASSDLPMSEAEFHGALDPVAIVRDRATSGGPQPAEMARMLGEADEAVKRQDAWIKARRDHIEASLRSLDGDFGKLLQASP